MYRARAFDVTCSGKAAGVRVGQGGPGLAACNGWQMRRLRTGQPAEDTTDEKKNSESFGKEVEASEPIVRIRLSAAILFMQVSLHLYLGLWQ